MDGCVDGVVVEGSVVDGVAVDGCVVVDGVVDGSVVVAGGVVVSVVVSFVPGFKNITAKMMITAATTRPIAVFRFILAPPVYFLTLIYRARRVVFNSKGAVVLAVGCLTVLSNCTPE